MHVHFFAINSINLCCTSNWVQNREKFVLWLPKLLSSAYHELVTRVGFVRISRGKSGLSIFFTEFWVYLKKKKNLGYTQCSVKKNPLNLVFTKILWSLNIPYTLSHRFFSPLQWWLLNLAKKEIFGGNK